MVHRKSAPPGSAAFTLLELLIVVVVLVATASLVVSMTGEAEAKGADHAARATLTNLRDAIVGGAASPGYVADMPGYPTTVAVLLEKPLGAQSFDPSTGRGWRGPYVRSVTGAYAADPARGFVAVYGADGDPAVLDPWGQPVVLQVPDSATATTDEELRHARLVSAGPDGYLTTPRTDAEASPGESLLPPRSLSGDDIVLYLRVADTRVP